MDENIVNLKMYFDKLIKTIETQASFKFGNKHIVDKQRIDDILCCIDANFPKILKLYKKHHGSTDKNIKSFKEYDRLIANIKIKPILGNNSYSINYKETVQIASNLGITLSSDVKYIEKSYPNLK